MDLFKKYAPYLLIVIPGLVFIAAGGAKLFGVEAVHASFKVLSQDWPLPPWFGYFIGACELAGGIALFVAALRKLAAVGLGIIMAGAIYFHFAYNVPTPVPAMVLLVLMIFVVIWPWNRQEMA